MRKLKQGTHGNLVGKPTGEVERTVEKMMSGRITRKNKNISLSSEMEVRRENLRQPIPHVPLRCEGIQTSTADFPPEP